MCYSIKIKDYYYIMDVLVQEGSYDNGGFVSATVDMHMCIWVDGGGGRGMCVCGGGEGR